LIAYTGTIERAAIWRPFCVLRGRNQDSCASGAGECRPTEYVQGWVLWWSDDEQRLKVAKQFQLLRIEYLQRIWPMV